MPAFAAVLQQVALFFVLDQDDRDVGGPGFGAEVVDGVDDALDVEAFILAGAQRALDIDDQECGAHGFLP
ncbi:hypothetical protein D3C86_2190490 [compost metagenome]